MDVCLISDQGELVGQSPAPADRDRPYRLTRRVAAYDEPVRGVVESMDGASNAELAKVNIHRHDFHGDWNYTISPTTTTVVNKS